jgi:hypothetical protein
VPQEIKRFYRIDAGGTIPPLEAVIDIGRTKLSLESIFLLARSALSHDETLQTVSCRPCRARPLLALITRWGEISAEIDGTFKFLLSACTPDAKQRSDQERAMAEF